MIDRVIDFWRALDRRDYATILSLVAEDCVWQREVLVSGRAAIGEALSKRPAGLMTRHQITNLRVKSDGDGCSVAFLITTFGVVRSGEEDSPPDCGGPALVADGEMRFSIDGETILITAIGAEIVFLAPQK
ncbi:nuclear transport factor 2 family protein [Sphingosinithalassobacter portus]|uniref:nuclear transport factor 2 family protein n=1 Tax=Stakelama portus TaxID=2676234 RepID=UPI001961FA66|nr:nuclear transport factor 2 family protein [Sphingosinithalassobacter portus]